MARKVNVRVEARNVKYKSKEDKERAFRHLLALFKREVDDTGVLNVYKQKQYHESNSEKRRRKEKESILRRQKELREKIKNHFG